MTTIAYDGKTLAADRRASKGTRRAVVVCKLAVLPVPGLGVCRVGFAGDWRTLEEAVERPRSGITGLAIDRRGRAWIRLSLEPWAQAPDQDRVAIGSGEDYALGALGAGASARRAVIVAGLFDPFTGDGVDILRP